jgi:hypothetical protein
MSMGISRRALFGAVGAAGVIAGAIMAGRQGLARRPLALVDKDLTPQELAAVRALLPGLHPRRLESDLVWQWRRGLGKRLEGGRTAIAIVRWDKALVLAGLAREAGLKVRQEQVGRSMFRVELG